jgi:hypothetical protein
MNQYLALAIRFDGEITNSIGTDSQFPQTVNKQICKEFECPANYYDSIFLIRDNEVIFHWTLGKDF